MTESAVNPSEDTPGSTSLPLLDRARAGSDQAAWERLVSLYHPLVAGWCRFAGLQGADADDVAQEVFAAVSRSLSGFSHSPEQGGFRAWLRRIAQNKMRDLWQARQAKAPQGVGGSDAHEQMLAVPALDAADPQEAGVLYRRALELISRDFGERTWRAFWRVVIDGQRPRDVAGELGMTAGAVSSAKARVLSRLRQEFAGLIDDGT